MWVYLPQPVSQNLNATPPPQSHLDNCPQASHARPLLELHTHTRSYIQYTDLHTHSTHSTHAHTYSTHTAHIHLRTHTAHIHLHAHTIIHTQHTCTHLHTHSTHTFTHSTHTRSYIQYTHSTHTRSPASAVLALARTTRHMDQRITVSAK